MSVSSVRRTELRWINAIAFCILGLLFAPAVSAAGSFGRTPTPNFVVTASVPAPNPKRLRQVDGGSYDLLYDTQVRLEGGVETTYRRRVYKLLDRSALEDGAQVEINFDPSYESAYLHRITRIRDGRTADVTRRSEIDIIRQEKDLDEGILDGTKTAVVRIPDVRAGDIVDVSWSWVSKPPLWTGNYFGDFQLGWSTPVGLTRVRIDLPAGTPLSVLSYRGAPSARTYRAAGREIREWIRIDPEPIVDDEDSPEWYRPWSRISLTTMPTWKQVADWALPLYAAASQLPPSLETEAKRIERYGGGPQSKAVWALRLVQDEIRYTSLSIGVGSYKPRPPAVVASSGWGDCKDKALLLVVLLKRLEIDAWPALTDLDEGAALSREAPSPLAFDHVIVGIQIGGKTFWVDPTISHQGGSLFNLASLPYGYALPIRAGQRGLEKIPVQPPSGSTVDATETYRFASNSMLLNVVTTYRAGDADDARARFSRAALADREREYLNYYASDLPGLRLRSPLSVSDDRAANLVTVREAYVWPPSAYDAALLEKFPVNVSTLDGVFTYPKGGSRTHPLVLAYPIHRTHKIIIKTPEMSVAAPDDVDIKGKAFSFKLRSKRAHDILAIQFSLRGTSPILLAKEFSGFRKDADELASNLSWTLAISPGLAMSDGQEVFAAATFICLFLLLIAGLIHARARKDTERDGEKYYPVPVSKFLLLGVATWGVYQIYWFWRQWRWIQRHEESEIMPFWRSFFGVFWLYPLFRTANRQAEPTVPNWRGIIGAILYFVWSVSNTLAERLLDASPLVTVSGLISPIFALPALVAVNRANQLEMVRSNGRWGWLAIATVPVGIVAILAIEATS